MSESRITVYGFGYVGKALVRFLKDHYKLQIVDPNPVFNDSDDDLKGLAIQSPENAHATEFAVICVPTPMSEDGSCDTSIVEGIVAAGKHTNYLIKSTIPPGTTAWLAEKTGKSICFSPEYIGEGKYEIPFWQGYPHPTNMKVHAFHIFGGPDQATTRWIEVWQKVAGWTAKYLQCDSTTAEMVKYAENTYLATMKIYFDELYSIAGIHGVNYNRLRELMLEDKRVSRAMSLIFPDNRGFSGKCLPKDLSAIIASSQHAGYDPEFLMEVRRSNKRFREGK